MSKGTMGIAAENENVQFLENENRKEYTSRTAPTRAKRVEASKPLSVPEYFQDKRNLVIIFILHSLHFIPISRGFLFVILVLVA